MTDTAVPTTTPIPTTTNGVAHAAAAFVAAPPPRDPLLELGLQAARARGRSPGPAEVAFMAEKIAGLGSNDRVELENVFRSALEAMAADKTAAAPAAAEVAEVAAPPAPAPVAVASVAPVAPTPTAPMVDPVPVAVTPPPADIDPFPDTLGLTRMRAPAVYRYTAAAIEAGKYTAVIGGVTVERYRPLTGALLHRYPRVDADAICTLRLTAPGLVGDHRGQLVTIEHGDVSFPQVYGLHLLGALANAISDKGHPHVEIRPTGFVMGIDGRKEYTFEVSVLSEDKPDAHGKRTLKLLSRESVGTAD